MPIDEATLQTKLAELRAEREQTAANLNALTGAITVLERLLADEPGETPKPAKASAKRS